MITLDLIFTAIILIISISLHEYAHAWMANRLGDPTPRLQGRLTPSPLAHIDPIGFLLVFIIGFGWGRAVQYNPNYLKHPLRDELQIAMAGPIMNIILTIGGMIILMIYQATVLGQNAVLLGTGDIVVQFWLQFCFMNIALAVFNMIPIPPLDGYRLVKIFFPDFIGRLEGYGQYFFIGVAILAMSGGFSGYVHGVSVWIFNLLYSIVSLFL